MGGSFQPPQGSYWYLTGLGSSVNCWQNSLCLGTSESSSCDHSWSLTYPSRIHSVTLSTPLIHLAFPIFSSNLLLFCLSQSHDLKEYPTSTALESIKFLLLFSAETLDQRCRGFMLKISCRGFKLAFISCWGLKATSLCSWRRNHFVLT